MIDPSIVYKSPQADMGYDIVRNYPSPVWAQMADFLQADYKDIDPLYGNLEDVDKLISELKKRDMKLMMDLVVNHTSDQVGAPESTLIRGY